MTPPVVATTAPLLSVEGLGVSLNGSEPVHDVSFAVDRGSALGLVGASGSGKSLTALAILRLLPAAARASGAVRFEGTLLSGLDGPAIARIRGRDIGMVFQEPMTALNPLMRCGEQVAETVRIHEAVGRTVAAARARAALASVGLPASAGAFERYPHELSGGQRQRVAIAMAIVLGPRLLIADEPTTALDVSTQAQVLALLKSLVRERGMALILVSHDLAVIGEVAQRILVMHEGRIVDECGGGRWGDMQHPYAKALLAAAALPEFRGGGAAAPERAATSSRECAVPALEVRDVVRVYRGRRRSLWRSAAAIRAVDGVSLEVHAGETVGVVGESGAGKSSLLHAILALDELQAGDVRVCGESLSSARGAARRRLRRSLQAVFQDPFGSLDPLWTVERVIAEPLHLLDGPPSAAERRQRVAAALAQVGLSEELHADRLPRELSGGQRQRVAIARALITKPAIIVFDEAVSALDVLLRAQVLQLIETLAHVSGLASLFVTHDLAVVRAIADRVYVMRAGRIVETGPTAALFESPQQDYTRQLIAAMPRLERGSGLT